MKTTQPSTQTYARLGLVLAVLLLALVLAACGGDDTPPAVETAVVSPTDSAEVPADTPTTAPQATEAPATEITATEAPPTDEPTAEPATEVPAESEVAGGDCSNAYYPVVDGRVYTYTSNISGLGPSTYSMTYSDVTDSSFTVTTGVGEEEAVAITWECSEEGLFSPEFSQFPGSGELLTIEFVEAEGVTVPAEEMFQAGESWTTHYVANATVGEEGVGELTLIQTMDMTHTVVGTEAVSVPAGDYSDAVRVDTAGTISVTFSIGGTSQPATSTEMNYTSWYVRDVGMVRQEFESLFGEEGSDDAGVTELVSFE